MRTKPHAVPQLLACTQDTRGDPYVTWVQTNSVITAGTTQARTTVTQLTPRFYELVHWWWFRRLSFPVHQPQSYLMEGNSRGDFTDS